MYALAGARYEDADRRLFLRYRLSTGTWEYLPETPGPQGAGNALVWSGWDGKLYAFLGSSQHGTVFARYDPQSVSWVLRADPPGGVDDGASLAWAGGRFLYALRGEYHESSPLRDFWRYDIETDTWSALSPIPDPGGVGDGGSLLWIGNFLGDQADYLYALGGGACDEAPGYGFYRYRISTDTWETLESLPYPVGYYNGNRLAYASGSIFYWQGTPSTWSGGGARFCAYPVSAPANNPPVLSSGSVSPTSGTTDTTFTYEVTYTDADGDAPSYVRVYIDGVGYPMIKVSGTYSGGAVYRYTTTLGAGPHTYYFAASDGTDSARLPSSGSYSGPTVGTANTPPTLSYGGVSPSSGAIGTTFTYEVTYTDADGDAPSYVNVYIDGVPYSMSRASGTYTEGALYRYATSSLGAGSHTYYFEASDNRGAGARLPASGSFSGPTVGVRGSPPTASFGYSPASPTTEDTVQFTDRSTDNDGTIVSWWWDFGDGETSTLQNPSHRYSRSGTYIVTLKITDNEGMEDYAFQAITVTSPAPEVAFTFTGPWRRAPRRRHDLLRLLGGRGNRGARHHRCPGQDHLQGSGLPRPDPVLQERKRKVRGKFLRRFGGRGERLARRGSEEGPRPRLRYCGVGPFCVYRVCSLPDYPSHKTNPSLSNRISPSSPLISPFHSPRGISHYSCGRGGVSSIRLRKKGKRRAGEGGGDQGVLP